MACKTLGELRNIRAATMQFAWNVERTIHACEIRKLDWAIKELVMDEVQHERSYQGGGVVGRMAWTRCAEERWKTRCGE